MKKPMIWLLLIIAPFVQAQPNSEAFPNEFDKDGKKQGHWFWELEEGTLRSSPNAIFKSGKFSNGKPKGIFIEYDAQRRKINEAAYVSVEENRVDGTMTWYDSLGFVEGYLLFDKEGIRPDVGATLAFVRKKHRPTEGIYLKSLQTLSIWTSGHPQEIPVQKEVVTLLLAAEGEKSIALADELILLGWMHLNRNEPTQAQPLFQQAYFTKQELLGESHPETLTCQSYIASTYEELGEIEKAENLYWQIASLWQKTDRNESEQHAQLLSDIAFMYIRQQRFTEAQKVLNRVKTIVPPGSSLFEKCVYGLGSIAEVLGEYPKALEFYEQVLLANRQKEQRTLGHLWSLRDVLRMQLQLANNEKALKLLEEAYEVSKSFEGKAQLEHLKSIEDLTAMCDFERAEQLWQESLSLRATRNGKASESYLFGLEKVQGFYVATQKPQKAIEKALESLDVSKAVYGAESNEVAQYLNQLGSTYHTYGNLNQARKYYEEAIDLVVKLKGPDHTDQSNMLVGLGMIHTQQEKREDAENAYKKLVAINEKRFGKQHERTKQSLSQFMDFYRISGQLSKLESLKKEYQLN